MNGQRCSVDRLKELYEELMKLLVKTLSIINKENDFPRNLSKVSSVLYSPVKDWGQSESKNGLECIYNIKEEIISTEMIKCDNITKKINDPNINIALFGDVSAGKSQTINAILGRNLFIPVYCNGTICFAEIFLSNNATESIELPDNYPQRVIECASVDDMRLKVKEYANYNGENKLNPDQVLRINVDIKDSKIMRENVALIDCPGGNASLEVAERIKSVVAVADIFLFIFNQVLFHQQRIFFRELLKVTSPPNIFVLINKWDETDNDDPDDVARVLTSTKSEIEAWLREVDGDYNGEGGERIFFVSANETLQSKIDSSTEVVSDNQRRRLEEFARFERILGDHLGDGKAIKIGKINSELETMRTRITDVKTKLNGVINMLMTKKVICLALIQEKMNKVNNLRKELQVRMEERINKKIEDDVDYYYSKLLKEINKELNVFIEDEDLRWKPTITSRKDDFVASSKHYFGGIKGCNVSKVKHFFTGKKKPSDEESKINDVIKCRQAELVVRVTSAINDDCDVIEGALRAELNHYDGYLRGMREMLS